MKTKISYTCGFAFTHDQVKVALILKNRGPVGMAGYVNGIGGKMELGESARGAQSREFYEEAGVLIAPERWTTFHFERKLYVPEIEPTIYFMTAVMSPIEAVSQFSKTNETVMLHPAVHVPLFKQYFHNLKWLVPMALDYLAYPEERWVEG